MSTMIGRYSRFTDAATAGGTLPVPLGVVHWLAQEPMDDVDEDNVATALSYFAANGGVPQ